MAQTATLERMQTMGSRAAAVVTQSVREARVKAQGGWNVRAWQVGVIAVSFLGAAGVGISHLMERHKNSLVANQTKEVLATYYKNQIGAQLGIDPKKVGVRELELAAGSNRDIAKVVTKVEQEKNDNNRANNFVTAGSLALGGWAPGLSGISHLAAHTGVAMAGTTVAAAFSKDILHTQVVMEHLDDKIGKGQAITAADIVTLRISKDEKLQHDLKKQNGTAFHKMNEAQQRAVLVSMPDMQDAAQIAEKVNAGQIDLQDALMTVGTKPQTSWAQRVGGPRGAATSFTAQENARRAANDQGLAQSQAI